MNGDEDDVEGWAPEEAEPERGEDPAVAEAREQLLQFFEKRSEETFYEQQLAVIFESRGRVHLTALQQRREGVEPEMLELRQGFFHWITTKALKRLEAEGKIESEMKPLGIAEEGTPGVNVRFYHSRRHRYRKRQMNEMLRLMREYTKLGRAIGQHGETMISEALGAVGFRTAARTVREFQGKRWTGSGHDLDRVYERDGVFYGAEIKNTLKYIPRQEFLVKLGMCKELGLKPLFIGRMYPKNYIKETWEAGGYTIVLGKQMYPFGAEGLMERVRERLELPVAAPRAVEEGVIGKFVSWHLRNV